MVIDPRNNSNVKYAALMKTIQANAPSAPISQFAPPTPPPTVIGYRVFSASTPLTPRRQRNRSALNCGVSTLVLSIALIIGIIVGGPYIERFVIKISTPAPPIGSLPNYRLNYSDYYSQMTAGIDVVAGVKPNDYTTVITITRCGQQAINSDGTIVEVVCTYAYVGSQDGLTHSDLATYYFLYDDAHGWRMGWCSSDGYSDFNNCHVYS